MSGKTSRLRVVQPNHLLTVQDRGRQGAMRYGVSQSGPMDWVRFTLATVLAGDTSAAFEVGIAGASFFAEGPVRIAVTGPGFGVRISGGRTASFEAPVLLTLEDGETLSLSPGATGMWAYVAVGGIDFGPPVLGSLATNARTGLGARDFGRPFPCTAAAHADPVLYEDPLDDGGPIGLLPGPQQHMFPEEVRRTFASEPYRLTDALDRMGYRLEGPPLKAVRHDIISDGIVEGAIQVPGNGQPIVLCADRAPTGGYPKIAIVANADRPRLTQHRPGDTVRFAWIDEDEARARRRTLAERCRHPIPRIRAAFTSEFLAARNLIGGVWGPSPAHED
ncbi:biotin-dependent carboxyltransferase family protein [Acuticoccus kandeliae]|uniref:5-oxoprolinase subunit C family protein n=1 Tax=Acuticoccus kandeliae TaxID=2073160 RepID=UPI000D3E8F0F|nr:biotin-dependent carboxyltransferase family protein [Acuticoccus kandeliae]